MNSRTLLFLFLAACASGKASVDDNTGDVTDGADGADGADGGVDGTEPTAAFTVSPDAVEVPVFFVGQTHEEVLTITNTGDATLSLSASVASGKPEAWFLDLGDPAPTAGGTAELRVAIVPPDWGNYDSTVTVTDATSGETVAVPFTVSVQIDADGDGYGSAETGGGDCDDANLEVNPGVEETWYDGIDSNCDGADDFDQDGDGVQVDEDCDDLDATAFPGNTEEWYNGVDNACDGGSDDDQDGDGYDIGEDCDDVDATINPGVDEVWYDGIDQNCDGANDDDQDGDGYVLASDCDDTNPEAYPGADEIWYNGIDEGCDGGNDYDQDGDGVDYPTDCNDTDPTVTGPVPEVVDGIDNDCSGYIDDFTVTDMDAGVVYGASSQAIGNNFNLSIGGDMDEDGGEDLAIGSTANTTGYVWVLDGSAMVGANGVVTDYDTAQVTGANYYYAVSNVVGPMVDLNGDSYADLITASTGYYGYGYAYLFNSAVTSESVTGNDTYWTGDSNSDGLRVVVAGDIDGDGTNDVVTGSPTDNYGSSGTQVGNVAIFEGSNNWDDEGYDLGDADDQIHGSTSYDYLGYSLYVSDWTGDGYADILAGAYGEDTGASSGGAVYLFAGNASLAWSGDQANSVDSFRISGTTGSGYVGADTLATPGDVDGDGDLDLLISSEYVGGAWLFYNDSGLSGDLTVSNADVSFTGTAGDFASSVSYSSDVDHDGLVDILIGDDGNDAAATNAGAIFLFLGSTGFSGAMTATNSTGALWGAAAEDALGSGMAAGADLTADGYNDVIVGAAGSDGYASGGGAVYLLSGWQ